MDELKLYLSLLQTETGVRMISKMLWLQVFKLIVRIVRLLFVAVIISLILSAGPLVGLVSLTFTQILEILIVLRLAYGVIK